MNFFEINPIFFKKGVDFLWQSGYYLIQVSTLGKGVLTDEYVSDKYYISLGGTHYETQAFG